MQKEEELDLVRSRLEKIAQQMSQIRVNQQRGREREVARERDGVRDGVPRGSMRSHSHSAGSRTPPPSFSRSRRSPARSRFAPDANAPGYDVEPGSQGHRPYGIAGQTPAGFQGTAAASTSYQGVAGTPATYQNWHNPAVSEQAMVPGAVAEQQPLEGEGNLLYRTVDENGVSGNGVASRGFRRWEDWEELPLSTQSIQTLVLYGINEVFSHVMVHLAQDATQCTFYEEQASASRAGRSTSRGYAPRDVYGNYASSPDIL